MLRYGGKGKLLAKEQPKTGIQHKFRSVFFTADEWQHYEKIARAYRADEQQVGTRTTLRKAIFRKVIYEAFEKPESTGLVKLVPGKEDEDRFKKDPVPQPYQTAEEQGRKLSDDDRV